MKLKVLLPAIGAVVCVLAWAAMLVGIWLKVEMKTHVLLVTAAAVSTEVLVWTVAAGLGLSMFDARKRIWGRITAPFRAKG